MRILIAVTLESNTSRLRDGEKDLKQEQVTLKSMRSGEEHKVFLEDLESMNLKGF